MKTLEDEWYVVMKAYKFFVLEKKIALSYM